MGIVILDDDGESVALDDNDVTSLFLAMGGLEGATVSACPECRSRVVAAVALADLLGEGAPHPRSLELVELAEDAPTLHLYVDDRTASCRHARWRDPAAREWVDIVMELRRGA